MQPNHCRLLPLSAAVAALLSSTAAGQLQVRTYGQPSEARPGGPGSLGLYLAQVGDTAQPALRLEGGAPGAAALFLLAGESGATELPNGGTVLVGTPRVQVLGQFDARGVCVQSLDAAVIERFGGVLFVQGVQPSAASGLELSGGLQLTREAPRSAGAAALPPDTILVDEVANLLREGVLEAALAVALNSDGDELAITIQGGIEVPVYPGITAGGKAAFEVSVERGTDSAGTVVYDVAIAADLAASMGVGAGLVGAGIDAGAGVEITWRFATPHEVARALRSMAILQAVADRVEAACIAVDGQLDRLDRAVESARLAADRARAALRSRSPFANSPFVQELQRRQDALRAQRRAFADRARRAVCRLVGWVADARIFLIRHQHGYEVRQTMAADAEAGVDFVDTGAVSGSNLGASLEVGLERQIVLRAEFVPECGAMAFERQVVLKRTLTGSVGLGVGATATRERVVELKTKLQAGEDGVQREASGTTVEMTLDGMAALVLGAFATGQAGIGCEVGVELRLEDLIGYSRDGIAILLGDDDHAIVRLLAAVPVELVVRGRYEAAFAVGFGIDVDGVFEGGLGATIAMTDAGPGFRYSAGSGGSLDRSDSIARTLVEAGRDALLDVGLPARLRAVHDEVARVLRR